MIKKKQFSLKQFLISGAYMQLSPTQFLIGWGDCIASPRLNLQKKTPSFYLNSFFLRRMTPWLQFEHSAIATIDDFAQWIGDGAPTSISEWTIDSQEVYEGGFAQLQEQFCSGKLLKGVPYLFKRSAVQMNEELLRSIISHTLNRLNRRTNYAYGYWSGSIGIVGVTPEKLFTHSSRHAQKLETMALAGTCALEDVHLLQLESEKILEEHFYVVEGIKESCSRLGEVSILDRQIVKLPTVAHLLTPITIDLKRPFDFQDAVKALHPTPALGTYPKESGREWLESYDKKLPRHFYGAPIGFYLPQEGVSTCYVAIRNVQWDSQGIFIAAGGGVVKDSALDKEREEISLKMQAIQNLLGF